MLIKGRLWRHTIVVQLTVHALSTKTTIASLLLSIVAVLAHVGCVMRGTEIWMVVQIATTLSGLGVGLVHMLSLL